MRTSLFTSYFVHILSKTALSSSKEECLLAYLHKRIKTAVTN